MNGSVLTNNVICNHEAEYVKLSSKLGFLDGYKFETGFYIWYFKLHSDFIEVYVHNNISPLQIVRLEEE